MKKAVFFEFRLYVAGDAPNSTQAQANLEEICRAHLVGRCKVEIIDVLSEPMRALDDGILLTPMLVRLKPAPVRRILGNLSLRVPVLQALGLRGEP